MEKSTLEKISDKILIVLLKEIYRELDGETEPELEDFNHAAVESLTTMGLGDNSYIDTNFVFELYKRNVGNEFKIPLDRPKAGLYSIDIDVHSREYARRTYRHEFSCYNQSNAYDLFQYMFDEGEIGTYDGDEVDYDVYDSEESSETVDKDSIRKIG